MNTSESMGSERQARFAEAHAILGRPARDTFSRIWDTQSAGVRLMLLRSAGRQEVIARHLAGRQWAELTADTRGAVKTAAVRLRDLLNTLLSDTTH